MRSLFVRFVVATLTCLAAVPAQAGPAAQAGVIDLKMVCGIWGAFNPTPGLEREGLCVYDAAAVYAADSGAGTGGTTWLWTWHEDADGRTTFRTDFAADPYLEAGPLGDRALLNGEVEACEVWLLLRTREEDITKRYVLDPYHSVDD